MFNFPKNIWVMFVAQSLIQPIIPALILVGGLLGHAIAPDPRLATLPMFVATFSTAFAIAPAIVLQKKIGRKQGTILGFSFAVIGSLLCLFSTLYSSFILLILGSSCFGICQAFILQLRFIAIECLSSQNDAPSVISLLMLTGIIAAFIGPEIMTLGKDMISNEHEFAGSFLLLMLVSLIGLAVFSQFENPKLSNFQDVVEIRDGARSTFELIKQPLFLVALVAGSLSFALMSYVMTAAPISMHTEHGHNLDSVKWVIQSHIASMYLPSLFTGALIKRLGITCVLGLGVFIYFIMIVVALAGHSVMHYWWAMILLGIGWNFLFTSATTILVTTYKLQERFKAQAINDSVLFSLQAIASLSVGLVMFSYKWDGLIYSCLPMLALILFCVIHHYIINRDKINPEINASVVKKDNE